MFIEAENWNLDLNPNVHSTLVWMNAITDKEEKILAFCSQNSISVLCMSNIHSHGCGY